MANSGLFDKRGEFFRGYFEKGLSFDDYVATGSPAQQERWRATRKAIELSAGQTKIIGSFVREMRVLFMSGVWCGDCIRQGPMIAAIESASPKIKCRFIDNQQFPELRDELRIAGGERVPVAVFLSEDFFEFMRFGDRPLSVYRRKASSELGPACEVGIIPPSGQERAAEVADWVDIFERVQLMLRLSPFLRERYGD